MEITRSVPAQKMTWLRMGPSRSGNRCFSPLIILSIPPAFPRTGVAVCDACLNLAGGATLWHESRVTCLIQLGCVHAGTERADGPTLRHGSRASGGVVDSWRYEEGRPPVRL